jgi:GntR family transcriptional regulator
MSISASGRSTVDFSRSSISRYIQLATLFRRRIESGQWRVGEQIPTVDELAAECGVARATIRQALGVLEDDRLIERFRAKGTFVKRRPQEELWCEVGTDWSGLLRSTEGAVIEVLSDTRHVSPVRLDIRTGKPAESYRHLHRRYWRHEMPYLLSDIYIDEALSGALSAEDVNTKSALRLISDMPGVAVSDVRQTLTIGTADLETAQALIMPLNAPVAFVDRRVVDRIGRLILLVQGIYRGDVVRFDIAFHASDAGAE